MLDSYRSGVHVAVDPGVIGAARVLDSVALLGRNAPTEPESLTGNRFELAGPGTLARFLGSSAASSPMPAIGAAWRLAALDQAGSPAATS